MIRKRKTPKGQTAEYHYEFMQSGKRYYGVCEGCTTEREALAYESKKRKEIKKIAEEESVPALIEKRIMALTNGKSIDMVEAIELMLQKPHKRDRSQKVIDQKRSFWRDWLAFMNATYPDIQKLSDVTKTHAEAYIAQLQSKGRFDKSIVMTILRKRGKVKTKTIERNYYLSNRTIIKIGQTLKEVFERLKTDAGLISNPFDGVILPMQKSTSRDAFTDEELKLIAENMTMPYIKPIFTIGLCTGLTLGDICLLRWDEINDGWIDNKRRRKTGVMLDIPIMPPLAALLSELEVNYRSEFVAPDLAAMYQENPAGVNYRIKKFLESLGIQTTVRPDAPDNGDSMDTEEGLQRRAIATKAAHALRHTFAYLAGVYEVPLPIVQSVLGHMSPEMTKLYQKHASRADKVKFFKKMPDILAAPTIAKQKQLAAPNSDRVSLLERLRHAAVGADDNKILKALKILEG